jgi:hypothetical protein
MIDRLQKIAPWLLMAGAMLAISYFVFNPSADVDQLARKQLNAVAEHVSTACPRSRRPLARLPMSTGSANE